MSVESSDQGGRPERPRLLLVDDDVALARVVGRMLADRFETTIVNDGRRALALVTAGERFDGILCDLEMPELSGMDLYDKLVEIEPTIARRILFLTGGAVTRRAMEFLGARERPPLEKPFDRATLIAAVEALLGP